MACASSRTHDTVAPDFPKKQAPTNPCRKNAEARPELTSDRTSKLPLLGSSRRPPEVNQDSPDPESSGLGRHFRQLVGNRPLSEHRCPLPCPLLPGLARRNYGKTTAFSGR